MFRLYKYRDNEENNTESMRIILPAFKSHDERHSY